jgi:hypothetical protein
MRAADVGSILVTDLKGQPCGIVTRGDLDEERQVAELLEDRRCACCGSTKHLHRHGEQQLCFSCRERAAEPQAFEGGGGD